MRILPLFAVLALATASAVGGTITSNPMGYFNVYSLGGIGTAAQPYGSDFGGVAGAAGNVYFNGFGLYAQGSTDGYGLRVGGSAYLSGSFAKSVSADGNVYINAAQIGGSVVAGGSIQPAYSGAGGSIAGNAIAGGQAAPGPNISVSGVQLSNQPYSPAADFTAINNYFRATSTAIGAMANTGSVTNNYGDLLFTGHSGVNVVTVDGATLQNAWGFSITAPAGATLLINVTDAMPTLDSTTWNFLGGISSSNVLVNMFHATTLSLSGGNDVNILAPFANTNFSSGALDGGLYVGTLTGNGQVNPGEFQGQVPTVPEPATLTLLALGGASLLTRRRARNRSLNL